MDQVRCITNVFSGRTGAQIAVRAFECGHDVTLLTSHPEVLGSISTMRATDIAHFRVRPYRTFDELEALMGETITAGDFDAVIHSAAVSDYRITGTFALANGTSFNPESMTWEADTGLPRMTQTRAGKVKSNHPELWLRLQPAPKLVDRVRSTWGFRGTLVKFKLEVGVSETELLDIAERSRQQSGADLMVANTLEGMHEWAYLGAAAGGYEHVPRGELPDRLIDEVTRGLPVRGKLERYALHRANCG
jgi:phosphopantothenate-cysteine ligase/phosphopantothenoylcysteine decarboxylase/phosphopantothenate--cysteine ligase